MENVRKLKREKISKKPIILRKKGTTFLHVFYSICIKNINTKKKHIISYYFAWISNFKFFKQKEICNCLKAITKIQNERIKVMYDGFSYFQCIEKCYFS